MYDYVLKVAQKWVSAPYNVDGWRLDVAADLGHSNDFNHQFWKDFRVALPEQYELTELLNTDWEEFGGNTKPEDQNWSVENKPYKKKEQALCLDLPPFTARIFKVKSVKHSAQKKTPKK